MPDFNAMSKEELLRYLAKEHGIYNPKKKIRVRKGMPVTVKLDCGYHVTGRVKDSRTLFIEFDSPICLPGYPPLKGGYYERSDLIAYVSPGVIKDDPE
jgi:hypothetical protein